MSAPAAVRWDLGRVAMAVFGVALQGRTYTRLLYLLLSFPLGLFYVLLLGTGVALGAALAITGVGLLLLLGCLVAAWAFAMFASRRSPATSCTCPRTCRTSSPTSTPTRRPWS